MAKSGNGLWEAYGEIKQSAVYGKLALPSADLVHNGYFAQDQGKPKDTSDSTKAADKAYEPIMRDKERLLSRGGDRLNNSLWEPVRTSVRSSGVTL